MSDTADIVGAGRPCRGCGQSVEDTARFCAQCGTPTANHALMAAAPGTSPGRDVFCRACGRAINSMARTCPGCGAPQAARGMEGEKSRVAAGMLAIFLGGFGVHKFYLARPFQGILYVLFCWTLIPALIGFIEGIAYLCMSDSGFARRYG